MQVGTPNDIHLFVSPLHSIVNMSNMTYYICQGMRVDKPLAWLHGEVKSPPFSQNARLEAGFLLRLLQRGESIEMPHSRPMPGVGARCHELRITDQGVNWRIMYRADTDAIVVLAVFGKKTGKTPRRIIDPCKNRLKEYDGK